MTTWLDNYKKSLDAIVAKKQAGVAATGSNDLASAYSIWAEVNRLNNVPGKGVGISAASIKKRNGKHSAFDTGFNAFKSGGSRLIDVLSRPNYAVMNTIKEMSQPGVNDENFAEAFWKGLSGQEKTTGSDVLKQNYPTMGRKTRAFTGFLGDVFLDPTTYIGAGLFGKIGKVAGIAGKSGKGAREAVAAEQAVKGAVGEKTANSLIDHLANVRKAEGPSLMPDMPFEVKQGSTVVDAIQRQKELDLVTARARAGSVTDEMAKIPALRYSPSLSEKITPPFNTKVADIVEETPIKAPSKTKPRGLDPAKARANAAYQYLLSNPGHTIVVRNGDRTRRITVAELQAAAKANPESAKMARSLIVNEANGIAKGVIKLEPRTLKGGAKADPIISLKTAKGEHGAGLTIDQMAKLLERGEIPKGKGADFYYKNGVKSSQITDIATAASNLSDEAATKLADFPLHDPSDLQNFYVSDFAGNAEPVGKFLERLGVKPRLVDPAKLVDTSADELIASAPSFTTKKVVGQEKTFSKMTKKQKEKWLATHKALLDPEDIDTLLSAQITSKSDAGYLDALKNKILSRRVEGGFTSVDDLMKAIEDGRVSEKDLQKLMTLTGAKSVDGIKRGVQRVLNDVIKHEKALQKEKDEIADMGKLWETPNSINSEIPTVAPKPVKPATAMIRDIINGDHTELISAKSTLDAGQVTDLKAMASYAVQHNILDAVDVEKYPFLSGFKQAKRTSAAKDKGEGNVLGDWNMQKQYTVWKGIIKRRRAEIKAEVARAGLKGAKARAANRAAMYDHVMPILRAWDKILVENGVAPVLTLDRTFTLSLTDVLDSLPRSFVEKHAFDVTKSRDGVKISEDIPPYVFAHIGDMMMMFQKGHITYNEARDAIKTYLARPSYPPHKKAPIIPGTSRMFNNIGHKSGSKAAEKYIDGLADEFMNAAQTLAQTLERNTATLVAADINGAKQISDEAMKAFASRISADDFIPRDLYGVANELDTVVESIARSVGKNIPAAKAIAREDIAVKTAEVLPPEVMAQAHLANKMAAVMKPKAGETRIIETHTARNTKVIHVTMEQLENEKSALQGLMDEIPEVDLSDTFEKIAWPVHMKLLRAFAPHLRNQDVRPFFVAENSAAQTSARNFAREFSRIHSRHTPEAINAAFKELQAGTQAADPIVRAAQDDMRAVVGSLFNDGDLNWFSTTGVTPEQLNAKFAHYGIPDKFRLSGDDYMDAWKSWDTEDPLQLMSKFQAAMQASVMERSLGAHLSSEFGSKVPKAGFVKVTPGKNTVLGKYLDPDSYFPKEIASQFSVLDNLMQEIAKPVSKNKALNLYDHVIHMVKAGLTIYRPGHHIRNQVGDMWFSWMDGVNTFGPYRSAMQVMAANQGRYKDLDALTALSVLGRDNAVAAGEKGKFLGKKVKIPEFVAHTTVGGKRLDLTPGDIFREARKQGILPDYSTLEDIGTFAERQMWTPHLPGKAKGKAHNVAAGFSEGRDHFTRLAHFIDVLNKGKFKTLQEAVDHAGARVRKWHPDGSDLSQFEKSTGRRLILFYSWQRKAIPLVFDSLVHKPGKVMIYPKAMYALAEANGVDLNSIGDPFPADQLFPDWLRDQVTGPQFDIGGQYWGINPGIPAVDVLNDYGNSPTGLLHTLAGSLTPVLKVPAELAVPTISGERADEGVQALNFKTGVPQRDLSDYLDQNTPGINTISNITNRSVFGLGQGTGVGLGDSPEEIAKANEKNKPGLDARALLNLLLGASATNMSTPGVIKGGEFDQKKAIKKAKENASR